MANHQQFPAGVEFFPEHPSDEKTRKIQTTPSPLLEGQTAPFPVKALYEELETNFEANLPKYLDKRFSVTGVAIMVGPDMHGLPTVQLSDAPGGPCYAHCIFPEEDILSKVAVGDCVTILSNYLVFGHPVGVVMKFSELVENRKQAVVFNRKPTNEEIRRVEFAPCPLIEQSAAFEAKDLYHSFYTDQSLLEKYVEKRMQVTGIVKKFGLDVHNLPSVELSDSVDGQTYAMCISHDKALMEDIEIGDKIVIEGNYLIMSTALGVIFKYSERK